MSAACRPSPGSDGWGLPPPPGARPRRSRGVGSGRSWSWSRWRPAAGRCPPACGAVRRQPSAIACGSRAASPPRGLGASGRVAAAGGRRRARGLTEPPPRGPQNGPSGAAGGRWGVGGWERRRRAPSGGGSGPCRCATPSSTRPPAGLPPPSRHAALGWGSLPPPPPPPPPPPRPSSPPGGSFLPGPCSEGARLGYLLGVCVGGVGGWAPECSRHPSLQLNCRTLPIRGTAALRAPPCRRLTKVTSCRPSSP